MYKVFSGSNGEYVAFENEDGFHHAPAQHSREANQGWGQTARLKREAARLNAPPTAAEQEQIDSDRAYEAYERAAEIRHSDRMALLHPGR